MLMEKIHAINPQRILWCCKEHEVSVEQLAKAIGISRATLERTVQGKDALTVNQLQKMADYFNRGLLFFLEHTPVNEVKIHSAQFRTISNQKPELSVKLKTLVERIERQRQVYIGLLENLGGDVAKMWYPDNLDPGIDNIKQVASIVRKWLGLVEGVDFLQLRRAVEDKGIMVFVSNGYNGQWQIARTSPVRGFSLCFEHYPVIAIKKQNTDGPQAFTLMHELAHLLLHRDSFIDDDEDLNRYQGKEKVANELAGHVLVPDNFLYQVDLADFPINDVAAYDNYLKRYSRLWCVSPEVILRRLLDEGKIEKTYYQHYRKYKQSIPFVEREGRGSRKYRFKEPVRMFGEPFVRTVLDALHNQQISLAKASTYLDNLKIKDIHKLEEIHAHF